MKFAMLSGYLDNYRELAEKTIWNNKHAYCVRHGYDLRLCREVLPGFATTGYGP